MATSKGPHPHVRLISLHDVAARCGIKKTRIYQDIRQGILPPPVKRGANCVRWVDHEIANVVAARVAGASDEELRYVVKECVALRPLVATPLLAEARAALATKRPADA